MPCATRWRAGSACARQARRPPMPSCAARSSGRARLPVAYQGAQNNQVDVTRRLVQITLNVEIVNQRTGKTLWQRSGLSLQGDYIPGQEQAGRQKAYDQLVTNIVEGAQSQW